MEIKNMTKEKLELGESITNYLKAFYVYTIGQLSAKTRNDLEIIRVDFNAITIIKERLREIAQIELSDDIEPEEQIEKLNLVPRAYLALKRAGISRISDLIRLSELEILSIKGSENFVQENIQQKLRERFGDELNDLRTKLKLRNKKELSIGYIVGRIDTLKRLRRHNIYTIRDILALTEQELKHAIAGKTIKVISKRLSELD